MPLAFKTRLRETLIGNNAFNSTGEYKEHNWENWQTEALGTEVKIIQSEWAYECKFVWRDVNVGMSGEFYSKSIIDDYNAM